jgi:hypothetical protein
LKSSHKYPWSLPLGPDGGDKLAGGKVELGHANKRQGSSIGLTRDRLVAVDWPGESPASGGAPAGNGTAVRERLGLNHVLHEELSCDLEKVLGRSPGLEK